MAFAIKGSEAIYQDPFDLAAGGASLTRASQDAVIFANPALMPLGDRVYRYAGIMPIVYGTPSVQDSLTTIQGAEPDKLVGTLFDIEPIRAGVGAILSVVLKNWGLAIFNGGMLDIDARRHGSDAGGPSIDIEAAFYNVAAMAVAGPVNKHLTLGMTTKYINKIEPDLSIPITDRERIQAMTDDPTAAQSLFNPAAGVGIDLGALYFFQGKTVDYNLALKIDDFGNTGFSCSSGSPCTESKKPFKQVISIGQGIAFHGTTHVIHLSADYRDILDAYEEATFKKVHLGMKILLQQHIGFALGLHDGIPTYGFRMDFWAIKFGLTRYSRELTNVIGEKRRDLAVAYVAIGW